MSNQFLLLDGEIREVRLSRRSDGNFEDALSGMILGPSQLSRGSLFGDRESAFQTLVAEVATAGNFPRFGTYSQLHL